MNLILCPNKTRNCKTFKKSCDSCNQYPECVCQWPKYFSLILFFKMQNVHLTLAWTSLNGVFIFYLYFQLVLSGVERLMEISSNYALSGISAASDQFNESNSEIDGRANDKTLFKSVIPGSIWNVNSFLIQFLFMWWDINFTDNTTLVFNFNRHKDSEMIHLSLSSDWHKDIFSFSHIYLYLLCSNCIVTLMNVYLYLA